jgi:hypothetical protein
MSLHVHIERLIVEADDGRVNRRTLEARLREELVARIAQDGLPSQLRTSSARAELPREPRTAGDAEAAGAGSAAAPGGIGTALYRSLDR